jgi:hypothetical protein
MDVREGLIANILELIGAGGCTLIALDFKFRPQ